MKILNFKNGLLVTAVSLLGFISCEKQEIHDDVDSTLESELSDTGEKVLESFVINDEGKKVSEEELLLSMDNSQGLQKNRAVFKRRMSQKDSRVLIRQDLHKNWANRICGRAREINVLQRNGAICSSFTFNATTFKNNIQRNIIPNQFPSTAAYWNLTRTIGPLQTSTVGVPRIIVSKLVRNPSNSPMTIGNLGSYTASQTREQSYTQTTSNSTSLSVEVSASFGFKDLFGFGTSVSGSTTLTNEKSKTVVSSKTSSITIDFSSNQRIPARQQCEVYLQKEERRTRKKVSIEIKILGKLGVSFDRKTRFIGKEFDKDRTAIVQDDYSVMYYLMDNAYKRGQIVKTYNVDDTFNRFTVIRDRCTNI